MYFFLCIIKREIFVFEEVGFLGVKIWIIDFLGREFIVWDRYIMLGRIDMEVYGFFLGKEFEF